MTGQNPQSAYLWCDQCRRSFTYTDAPEELCPVCGSEMRAMGKMAAVLRGLMATEMVASDLRSKHRQLVRMIWTRSGKGEQYFRVLEPDMTYSRFEARVTDLISQGAEEGWISIVLPPAPTIDEDCYRIEFKDEEKFILELEDLVERSRKPRKK